MKKTRGKIRVLGISIGHVDFVEAQLRGTTEKHRVLYERILQVQDLQSAWLLLLFCANSRATYSLRGIPPAETAQFARAHDNATWSCFTTLLGLPFGTERQDLASVPFASGGCGLHSALRSRAPAHWASWADSLRMIHRRHPAVAHIMIQHLIEPRGLRHFSAAVACVDEILDMGFNPPDWRPLATAQREFLAARLPGVLSIPAQGWQHEASIAVETTFMEVSILSQLVPAERAMLHSQGGPLAGFPFTAVPVHPHVRFDSDLFRVLLLRRLRLLLPLSSRTCRCGRPLDCLGHHRASCSRAGVLGRRGYGSHLQRSWRESLHQRLLEGLGSFGHQYPGPAPH